MPKNPHEFIQPIEIPILEFIHNTKYNHKIYNLIQNTLYEFAVGTEELKTIKALQLLWPLLQTKNIIRILYIYIHIYIFISHIYILSLHTKSF